MLKRVTVLLILSPTLSIPAGMLFFMKPFFLLLPSQHQLVPPLPSAIIEDDNPILLNPWPIPIASNPQTPSPPDQPSPSPSSPLPISIETTHVYPTTIHSPSSLDPSPPPSTSPLPLDALTSHFYSILWSY